MMIPDAFEHIHHLAAALGVQVSSWLVGKNHLRLGNQGPGNGHLSAFRRRQMGFIFQQFNLLPVLTARENILMPLLLDKKQPDEGYLECSSRCRRGL